MAVLGLLLSAHAQEREITGSVKDHAGAGIVGDTILVEGTTKGTTDRKSTRLNSSHKTESRMPSSA